MYHKKQVRRAPSFFLTLSVRFRGSVTAECTGTSTFFLSNAKRTVSWISDSGKYRNELNIFLVYLKCHSMQWFALGM